jgi:hypothetical protein
VKHCVAGLDAWSKHVRDTSNKNLIDYYEDGGLSNFQRAETDRTLRKATYHEYLKPYYDEITNQWTAKVQFFNTCTKIIETLPQLIRDDKDNEKVAECGIDHWYDSVGYGLISHHSSKSNASASPPLSGTYAYGELKLIGYTDAQIRKLRDKVKIIGDRKR